MAAGDGGASLTARSERGAAGAALGGRGERAEKADLGAPQPHIEGTFLYVIARCAPGSGASGDVSRRAARGRGRSAARTGRAAGIRGLGWDTMRRLPRPLGCARRAGPGCWERTPGACWDRKRLTSCRLSHLSGVAACSPPPAAPRSSSSHPFLGRKMSAESDACGRASRPACGDYGHSAGLASLISPFGPRLSPDFAGLTSGGAVTGPAVSLRGSGCQSQRWI